MNRSWSVSGWRRLRWVACAAVVPLLWACSARKLVAPVGDPSQARTQRYPQAINRNLDLLFVVDDSNSMLPLQAKMAQRLPDFMNVLKGLDGGLPNLHVAVISSSVGAGNILGVSGCDPGTGGRTDGKFQHRANCTMLHAGQTFISSIADPTAPNGRANNFDGDIADVFTCLAQLGERGCGFEHQFESTRWALEKASNPGDPDNGGFLRPDAYLAIVMVTNEDDCSAPWDSTLFDPSVQRMTDVSSVAGPFNGVALGGLQSYRCNEFGHRCGGMKPPHNPPATPTTFTDCVSAEDGVLIKVSDFVAFLRTLKARPEQLLVAAIAGPPGPYAVGSAPVQLAAGGEELQPAVVHSCVLPRPAGALPEYGDPPVRIKQWLDAFPRAVLSSICADDFRPAMTEIAEVFAQAINDQCFDGNILMKEDGTTPDCDVTQRSFVGSQAAPDQDKSLPFCPAGRAGTDATHPCWELAPSPICPTGRLLRVCYDVGCTPGARPMNRTDALLSCAVMGP